MSDYFKFACSPAHRSVSEKIEITTEPWDCEWMYKGRYRALHVPTDYKWDGASIPRFAWSLTGLTPFGIMDTPSLPHDVFYRSKGGVDIEKLAGCTLVNVGKIPCIVDRAEADWVLAEAMRMCRINAVRRSIVHGSVRAFGFRYWGGPPPKR